MHKGEFAGSLAAAQPKRVLILGESHHWSESEKERQTKAETYSTTDVMQRYLANYNACSGERRDRCYRFFDNIVSAFGIDPEKNRREFWERVYFGNYLDELCGVGDSYAVQRLRNQENRRKYNEQLFSFLLEQKIDIVFCFSRRVYSKLPPLEGSDREIPGAKGDLHRLDTCIYCPGERKQLGVCLEKSVTVYGLHHPSRGFNYRKYRDNLSAIVAENGLRYPGMAVKPQL